MTPASIAAFAVGLAEVTEEQPFGPTPDVYKVAGKIFAILSPDVTPAQVALKCEPELAAQLREEHDAVIPGYHLNKRHWNTLILDGSVPDQEIKDMVIHSYERVVAGLPKAARDRIRAIGPAGKPR
jgi:predicted DNA-binding protein (MmcQ/YjbR family)